ncbi:hypothetical protein ERN12_09455 [Rhodobacteraceae bacterium]|nr:hypothetical protein ERN12_09455 [Paracoccaceae bacterium]
MNGWEQITPDDQNDGLNQQDAGGARCVSLYLYTQFERPARAHRAPYRDLFEKLAAHLVAQRELEEAPPLLRAVWVVLLTEC